MCVYIESLSEQHSFIRVCAYPEFNSEQHGVYLNGAY